MEWHNPHSATMQADSHHHQPGAVNVTGNVQKLNVTLDIKGRSAIQLGVSMLTAAIICVRTFWALDALAVSIVKGEDNDKILLAQGFGFLFYLSTLVSVVLVTRGLRDLIFAQGAEQGARFWRYVPLIAGVALLVATTWQVVRLETRGVVGQLFLPVIMAGVNVAYMLWILRDREDADEIRSMPDGRGEHVQAKLQMALALLSNSNWILLASLGIWSSVSYLNYTLCWSANASQTMDDAQRLVLSAFFIGTILVVVLISSGLRDMQLNGAIEKYCPGAVAPERNGIFVLSGIVLMVLLLVSVSKLNTILHADMFDRLFTQGVVTLLFATTVRDRRDVDTIGKIQFVAKQE